MQWYHYYKSSSLKVIQYNSQGGFPPAGWAYAFVYNPHTGELSDGGEGSHHEDILGNDYEGWNKDFVFGRYYPTLGGIMIYPYSGGSNPEYKQQAEQAALNYYTQHPELA